MRRNKQTGAGKSILLICFLLANLAVLGGREKFNARESGDAVVTGLQMTVLDDKYAYMASNANWSAAFVNHAVTNKITLAIDPYGSSIMNEAFSVVALIEIEYDEWDAAAGGFVRRAETREISVDYTVAGPYRDKSTVFIEKGGHRVIVTVLDFYTTPSALSFVPNIELVTEIEVERYYTFNPDLTPANTMTFDNSSIESRNELLVTWDMIPGAEEYELEWVWVNSYNKDGNTLQPGEISMDPAIFRLNSTRVATANTYYNIPMIYEPGYLMVRYRPVGKDPLTSFRQVSPGRWSYDPAACGENPVVACWPSYYHHAGFANNQNWQMSVDYIEEGKNKPRVDYYDATLTPRQQQVRNNSTDKVLIGENIYDREGRPAINVLPVPADKQNLDYTDQFNLNEEGNSYSYQDFEGQDMASCNTAEPMNNSSGAANYYSPENNNRAGHQAYLPDAFGYPFIQSTFTPDKLSRLKAQSAPGRDHKIGSGHETKYYYGTPYQEELDRLFGHDVGLYKNYRKNTMIDANGQVQVTYVDASDRVIASALAGDSPSGLDSLGSVNSRDISVDLLKERSDSELTSFAKSHLVTKQASQDLHYKITGTTFETECEVPGVEDSRCYNCVVDVSLNVTDECGNQVLSPLQEGGQTITVGAISPECTEGPGVFEKNETLNMAVGAYTINRTISINQAALDAYTADYLDPEKNDCILTIEHFLEEELDSLNVQGCNVTCESCLEDLGVYESWSTNPYNEAFNPQCNPCMDEEEYNDALANCNLLCNSEARDCEGKLSMLLSDVNRHGQYGSISSDQNAPINDDGDLNIEAAASSNLNDVDPSLYPVSVFNDKNVLPGITYQNKVHNNWRTPYDPRYVNHPSGPAHYFNEHGEVDYVKVTILSAEAGSTEPVRYIPDILDAYKPAAPQPGTQIYVEPHHLKEVKDFLGRWWKEEWKRGLVAFHPEYIYYEECLLRHASNTFDLKLAAVNTIEDAYEFLQFSASEQPNPLKIVSAGGLPVVIDPYFDSTRTINPTYEKWEASLMTYLMNNYIADPSVGMTTIWKMAHITANCPLYEVSETSCPNCYDTYDGINTDEEWIQFKSYYMALKQSIQSYKSRLNGIRNDRYNGCIGAENFDPGSLNIYDFEKDGIGGFFGRLYDEYFDTRQLCNRWRDEHFREKTQRFPSAVGMTGFDTKTSQCYQSIPIEHATESGETYTVDFPVLDEVSQCRQRNEDIINEAVQKADRILFETCGQCPLARDLQLLIDGVSRETKDENGELTRKSRLVLNASDLNPEIDPINPAFYLSCYPFVSEYPEFTPDLEKALAFTGTDAIFWKQLSVSSRQVNAAIQRSGNPALCNVSIVVDPESEYNIQDIRGICCLNYEDNPQLLPLQAFRNFALEGLVEVENPQNGQPTIVKVPMEGVSCLNIAECPMPPVCKLHSDAETLEAALDVLAETDRLLTTVDFSTTSPLDQLAAGRLSMIGSGNITWSATQSGGQLNATFTTSDGGQQTMQLFLPPDATAGFNAITGFEGISEDNIAMDDDDTDKQFTIYAMVALPDGSLTSFKLKGRTSFSIATCRETGTVEGTLTAKDLE